MCVVKFFKFTFIFNTSQYLSEYCKNVLLIIYYFWGYSKVFHSKISLVWHKAKNLNFEGLSCIKFSSGVKGSLPCKLVNQNSGY